jgi:nicotinamide-nucleotide amidase
MWPEHIERLANSVIIEAKARRLMISTIESCTGGLLGACITSRPGSSAVYDGGFVVYSHKAKDMLLRVPVAVFEQHGSVSTFSAQELAREGLAHSPSDVAVALTGIAGPDGGTVVKPVGTAFAYVCRRDGFEKGHSLVPQHPDPRPRDDMRLAFVQLGLELLLDAIHEPPRASGDDEPIADAAVVNLRKNRP